MRGTPVNAQVIFKNLAGCLFIRTFFTEEFLYPLTYVKMLETVSTPPPFNKFDM